MKTAHELLEELSRCDVRLIVEPDPNPANWQQSTMRVSGKASALTPAIVADLRRLKTTLLAVLLVCDCRDCRDCTQRRALRIGKDYAANAQTAG